MDRFVGDRSALVVVSRISFGEVLVIENLLSDEICPSLLKISI